MARHRLLRDAVGFYPTTGGHTQTERWVVEFADGRRMFAKGAVDDASAGWLRAEVRNYRTIDTPWMPRFLDYDEAGHGLLVIEDLSRAEWTTEWSPDRVHRV